MLGESILVALWVILLYFGGATANEMLAYGAAAWAVLAFFARRARKVKARVKGA